MPDDLQGNIKPYCKQLAYDPDELPIVAVWIEGAGQDIRYIVENTNYKWDVPARAPGNLALVLLHSLELPRRALAAGNAAIFGGFSKDSQGGCQLQVTAKDSRDAWYLKFHIKIGLRPHKPAEITEILDAA